MKKELNDPLAGGKSLEIRLTMPLPAMEKTRVLQEMIDVLRRYYPTRTFSIEFAPKGVGGRRQVNVVVPFKTDCFD